MAVFDAPRGTGPYGITTTPDGWNSGDGEAVGC
jgi:streptogramin lyase